MQATGKKQQAEQTVVSINNVSLTFAASDAAVHALQNINLAIAAGEFISLIGPSGCGKTTLLRTIADLEAISSGGIEVNGKSPQAARLARSYGYVFQAAGLLAWRTAAQNVALPLEIMGYSKSERQQRVARQLEMVDLQGFERKYPWQLSGGMQQRISIARALCFDPAILLMDEPFGALDEIVRDKLNLQLNELWRKTGKTIIFVTHSIPEAVFLSTRIVVMSPRPGRIVKIIDCDLAQQRNLAMRDSIEFVEIAQQVRNSLQHGSADVN